MLAHELSSFSMMSIIRSISKSTRTGWLQSQVAKQALAPQGLENMDLGPKNCDRSAKILPHASPHEQAEVQPSPYLLQTHEVHGFFFPRPFLQEHLLFSCPPLDDDSTDGVGIDVGIDVAIDVAIDVGTDVGTDVDMDVLGGSVFVYICWVKHNMLALAVLHL